MLESNDTVPLVCFSLNSLKEVLESELIKVFTNILFELLPLCFWPEYFVFMNNLLYVGPWLIECENTVTKLKNNTKGVKHNESF